MNKHNDIDQEGAEVCSGRNGGGFKKKNRFKKHNNTYIDDVLRGVGFKTGREDPELYARKIERLPVGLYASRQLKMQPM